jgi:predicted DNA-binding transcriptional regulator AlpA
MIDPKQEALTPSRILREGDAAAYLGLSVKTLQKWRLTGQGPEFIKQGRCVRYALQALEAWLDRCRRKSTSDKGG